MDYETKLDLWKERRMKIYERRKSGEKFKDIASEYGVTRERVRQIYLKAERQVNNEAHDKTEGMH